MRCFLRLSMLGLISLAAPALAHADSFTTFDLSGLTLQNGSGTGSVTLNTTTGNLSASNITLVIGGVSYFFNAFSTTAYATDFSYFNVYDAANDIFQLQLLTPSLVGYNGGARLCTYNNPCDSFFAGAAVIGTQNTNFITSGALVVTPTPEPSSFILLGTGALGLLGMARRRYANA